MAERGGVRRATRGVTRRRGSGAGARLGASFVGAVMRAARAALPPALGPFHSAAWSFMGKVWTGNRDLHYEVWRRDRLGTLELGLHFESDPLTNARLLGAFRSRGREVRAALGAAALIEEWDRGWARVYESLPLVDDAASASRCGARLAEYVRALEPILRDELPADVPWRARA
jgi:hypothetical protein